MLRGLADLFTNEQILFSLNVLTGTAEAIKRTQNRRVEAEMALIRLCSPETDTDTAALLARISKLEAELAAIRANGLPAAPVRTAPAAPAMRSGAEEAPPAAEAEEPSVVPQPLAEDAPVASPASEEDDLFPFEGFGQESVTGGFADAFSEEEEDDAPFDPEAFLQERSAPPAPADEQPPEEPEKPAAPVPPAETPAASVPPEKAPAASVPAQGLPDGPVDKKLWNKVIVDLELSFPPLTGMLSGSSARISGNVLTVFPAKLLLLGEELIKSKLIPVAEKHLRRKYEIRFKY